MMVTIVKLSTSRTDWIEEEYMRIHIIHIITTTYIFYCKERYLPALDDD